MSYGVQNDGTFERKHIDDVQDSLVNKLQQEAGENIDLAQSSPVKQLLDTVALEVAGLWEAAEENYYASYYEDAFGTQLDNLLSLAGMSRIPRRSATGEVKFYSNPKNSTDKTIPKGTEVTTPSTDQAPPIPFKTVEEATLSGTNKDTSTSVLVPIEAKKPWETEVDEEWLGEKTNVASDTITELTEPISGVDRVTNPEPTGKPDKFVEGRDRETDAEFKLRYENTFAKSGDATMDAVRSEIFNAASDIENVHIEENVTMNDNTDSGGLPPKSFRATVHGGTADKIAQAIFDSRPAGIRSYGNESGTAETTDGVTKTEQFQRASQVNVYADVTVTTTDTFPGDGATRIRDNIIHYVGGTDSSDLAFPGTGIGEDVVYDQVFAAIMSVTGIREVDLTLGTSDAPTGTSNVSVGQTKVARTDANWLDVTVS
ncbi:baseplate J/gp47 family protein [Halorussus sp. MSC15.2]|uniref:baseplate J/gp47 family protein n=1 Tax=Halorussus sp. MSC15.2 TaxID=2283638 RepID=UPI0013D34127|nr:baseplate J/gp47 family protein [Halorussus sp. MSC15.2]NEU58594.1 baseplate J protein [Halorussus sp. MSC15.2]